MAGIMRIVSTAVLKGGAGKSTLTAALAVRASRDGARVAMVDLDYAQDSLGRWWGLRGEPENPALIEDFDDFMDERQRLIESGVDWLFLDTPPGAHDDLTELGISASDAVVIPLRCSLFDFGSIADTAALCEKHGKPHRLLSERRRPAPEGGAGARACAGASRLAPAAAVQDPDQLRRRLDPRRLQGKDRTRDPLDASPPRSTRSGSRSRR